MIPVFLSQLFKMKGPPPAEFWFSHSSALSSLSAVGESLAPCSLASFESMIPPFCPERIASQSPLGSFRIIFTVSGSTTCTSFRGSICQLAFPFKFLRRVKVNRTSSAVKGFPLANFTFGRSLNVYSLPSLERSHEVARTGV